MMRRWAARPIRVRLTAWYAVVMSLMLVLYAATTYVAVRHEFYEQLEEQLGDEVDALRGAQLLDAPGGRATLSARSEEMVRAHLSEVLVVLVAGLPVVVAVAGVGGYVLARRALAPIDDLASAARRITAERLHERLSVPNDRDEIGRLAAVVNDAFARLEASFAQLRRFTADASHELRTPLSVIRGIGEIGLGETRTPAEYQETIGSMLEEVDRLTHLVDTLLRLSYGDAGTVRLSREPVDLCQLVRDVASSLGVLAEEKGQRVTVEARPDVFISGDRLVLREAITNVVDNAIKYGPPGSTVDIAAWATGGGAGSDGAQATVTVSDQGPGVRPEHRTRIFDRFFRVEEARSRNASQVSPWDGTGLGLAIAKWAVEMHGGQISVESGTPRGSVFRIVLPIGEGPQQNKPVIHTTGVQG